VNLVSFLPRSIEDFRGKTISIPIATDIQDKSFFREFEGALDTHWNQSPWAKAQALRFRIEWKRVPQDQAFLTGKISLEEHLRQFPEGGAIVTTGAQSHHVRRNALILSLDPITPRTLAHELGHLMGFSDCYFRTLSGEGLLGLTQLEWNNPLFPDDLMCDNEVGTASWLKW
jgi:hypothetical protein